MRKVRRAGRSAAVSVPIAAAAVLCGCGESPGSSGDSAGRFGSPYQIVTNTGPAAPDEPPALLSDSLSVEVSYPGGCADHGFELMSVVEGDSATVWIRHDGGGDACEALISERLQLAVPEAVLAAPHVRLLNPNADVPFVVRWGAPLTNPGSEASD